MTDPGPVKTVDAPIASEAVPPPTSSALRILAGVAGVTVLTLGAVISLGGALVGAIGVWLASLIAKRRRRPLSRLMAWAGAVATTAIALLVAGGVLFAKLPEGALDEIKSAIDSVQKAHAPPPGMSRDAADSARIALQQDPATTTGMLIGGIIGGYFVLMMLSAFYGSIGWVGALLLMFAFTGAWLRRPAARAG